MNDEQIQAMDSITNLPKDTDSLPDIALYSFDTMDNVKDTDYLDEANFHQNSNSSILENVFSRTCADEIVDKPIKETSAVSTNKVMISYMSIRRIRHLNIEKIRNPGEQGIFAGNNFKKNYWREKYSRSFMV